MCLFAKSLHFKFVAQIKLFEWKVNRKKKELLRAQKLDVVSSGSMRFAKNVTAEKNAVWNFQQIARKKNC